MQCVVPVFIFSVKGIKQCAQLAYHFICLFKTVFAKALCFFLFNSIMKVPKTIADWVDLSNLAFPGRKRLFKDLMNVVPNQLYPAVLFDNFFTYV